MLLQFIQSPDVDLRKKIPFEMCIHDNHLLLLPLKDVDELKEEVQEARRVKMLHCPSKVESKYSCHHVKVENCKLYFK